MSSNPSELPTAGNSALDSSKSYYAMLFPVDGPNTYYVKTGVNPPGTFDSSQIIYMDLYTATVGLPYTYLGFFTVDLSTGTPMLTFTPSGAAGTSAPVAGFSGTPTIGFAPLTVVFTNTSTGSFTNSVWNFGNGTIVTNTTGGNVTNTYAAGGNYTVSLAVYGSAGSTTNTQTGYLAVSPAPKLGILPLNSGKLTLSGSNGPVGVQYRVLMATNLTQALTNWTPVLTNMIPSSGIYGYTNNAPTNKAAYFRLVSP
jgi:PKD repeat protein